MIAVIDYGMGNLKSVSKALELMGAKVKITHSPTTISQAKGVVLPGVGAFCYGMENLKKLNLIPVIYKVIKNHKPFLGICLGLQLLFSESEEHGSTHGLNIVKGKVKRFTHHLKIPHMGWNQIETKKNNEILTDISKKAYFYFVHSYYVKPEDTKVVIATTYYGQKFASVINQNNLWGLQFHPEKSGNWGLKILKNFLKRC